MGTGPSPYRVKLSGRFVERARLAQHITRGAPQGDSSQLLRGFGDTGIFAATRDNTTSYYVISIAAHATGIVARVNKVLGDAVVKGDSLVVLELMKVEISVEAAAAGIVKEVRCMVGQAVVEGDILMVLE